MAKLITAEEAKALADNNKIVDKMVRKILRAVRRAAKKGKYDLKYPSSYGEVIDNKICKRLRELGYKACTSIIAANIFVDWNNVGEE